MSRRSWARSTRWCQRRSWTEWFTRSRAETTREALSLPDGGGDLLGHRVQETVEFRRQQFRRNHHPPPVGETQHPEAGKDDNLVQFGPGALAAEVFRFDAHV